MLLMIRDLNLVCKMSFNKIKVLLKKENQMNGKKCKLSKNNLEDNDKLIN